MAAKEKRWSLREEVCGNSDSREKVVNKVPLYMQTYSWDCGLACASMVLQYLGKSSKKVYTSDLEELKCGESIWTIDLALLMKLHNIRHLLCTITFGVDQGYSKQAFYSNFVTDEERVSNLFQNAESMGINVQKRSVHCDEIVSHLGDGNLAIILVDWAQLECLWCDKRHCKSCCFSCLSSSCCRGYQGHFIVACGFDSKKKKIFYMNPSYDEEMCCCRMSQFDAARKSYGTDEDILFIYKDGVP
ncbi:GUCD1-like protein [Mya arenaria]|uniref:GUCD1-like protein n=1 Tax=Mya arenaria TaxID=6604 RepID=A0ABY7DZE9_MYAAR|nr:protein GUCD1-like [Mya arenaria]WAR03103.1 GUCD1-like protein [Mya arenaria]